MPTQDEILDELLNRINVKLTVTNSPDEQYAYYWVIDEIRYLRQADIFDSKLPHNELNCEEKVQETSAVEEQIPEISVLSPSDKQHLDEEKKNIVIKSLYAQVIP